MKSIKTYLALLLSIFINLSLVAQVGFNVGEEYIVAEKGPIYDSNIGVKGRVAVVNIGDTLVCLEPVNGEYLKVQFKDATGYFEYQRLEGYQDYAGSTKIETEQEEPQQPDYLVTESSSDQNNDTTSAVGQGVVLPPNDGPEKSKEKKTKPPTPDVYVDPKDAGPIDFKERECMYRINEEDEFSSKKRLRVSGEMIGYDAKGGRTVFSLFRIGDLYGLHITAPKANVGCLIENDGKVLIKLENGEIYEFLHIGPTTCFDGITAKIVFAEWDYDDYMTRSASELERESNRIFEKLSESKISAVRIVGDDYYTDIDLTELGTGYFLMYSHCVRE